MELYTLILHFPETAVGSDGATLESTEYYESEKEAVSRAMEIAGAFVKPKPDYWYLENGAGFKIWTDYPEAVKRAICYVKIAQKPVIEPVTMNNETNNIEP